MLSSLLGTAGRLEEATQMCGRSLLIRLTLLQVHEKVAESHFNLGLLYYRREMWGQALKELVLARRVYGKLLSALNAISPSKNTELPISTSSPSPSPISNNKAPHSNKNASAQSPIETLTLSISDCDMAIGQVEYQMGHIHKAYASLYMSYRARYALLGPSHSLVVSADGLLCKCREEMEGNMYVSLELKDKVCMLSYHTYPVHTYVYAVSVYISKLEDHTIVTKTQLHGLLCKAMGFYKGRLTSAHTNYSASNSTEESEINAVYDALCAVCTEGGMGGVSIAPTSILSPPPSPSPASPTKVASLSPPPSSYRFPPAITEEATRESKRIYGIYALTSSKRIASEC
ncbi:tetratricopeptide repeat protein [archaeon]|nr:MAG: tetratricopeptide repeat protein [archaeon]